MDVTQTMGEIVDVILQEKLEQLTKSIDNDVLRGCLIEGGWTQVEFHYQNNNQAIDVLDWCEKNIKEHQWMRLNQYFVFRKKKEAEWFMLRWL